METNDKRILELKEQIKKQKEELKNVRFAPTTNCILPFKGETFNLNTLNTERAVFLLIDLKTQFDSACSLDLVDEVNYNGYNIRDWMADVKLKLAHLSEMKKKAKLKQMESKLDTLLSEGTKVKIELDEIEKMVKGD